MKKFLNGTDIDESASWFNNRTIASQLGSVFTDFLAFAKANEGRDDHGYLVAMYKQKKTLFNVYGQKNKKKFTDNFDTPTKSEQIVFTKNEYNHLEFTFNRPDNKFVDGFILLQWKYGRKHAAIETR